MKICYKCEKEKQDSKFYKDKSSSDGLTSSCKKCQKEYQRKRYEENKDDIYNYDPVKEKGHSCEYCHKDFKSKNNPKYCSDKCRNKASYERNRGKTYEFTCKGCGKTAYATAKHAMNYCTHECYVEHRDFSHEKKQKECEMCGKSFMASLRQKYCSDECSNKYGAKTNIHFIKCRGCHEVFVSTHKNSKTCSDECTTKYRRLYVKFITMKGHYKDQAENPDNCLNCGKSFIRKYGHIYHYCSNHCKNEYLKKQRYKHKQKRKALKRGANVFQSIDPLKVFRRDKYRCQICGCKTNQKLRGTWEDNAPEIDHIVPLSKGGNHSYNNVQTLCRSCNQSKSNHYVGQQPLQFGEVSNAI